MKRFVITGCARSGTGYTARLFTQLGVETEHETVFSPYAETFAGWGAAPGESSWLAAPFIDRLPAGTVVLHQVRHPVDVIRSLLGVHFFDQTGTQLRRDARSLAQVARARGVSGATRRLFSGAWWGRGRRLRSDFVAFIQRHCPTVLDCDDEVERCVRYWIAWNRLVEDQASQADVSYQRYRLEDLDAPLVVQVLDLLGKAVSRDAVVAALRSLPTNANTRPGLPSRSPLAPLSSELVAVARRYGYELELGRATPGSRPTA